MFKKWLFLLLISTFFVGLISSVQAGEGKIGGNLKFFLYDKVGGKSGNDATFDNSFRTQPVLVGFNSLYIYISRELNDYLSLDVEPKVSASTGATPKLGTTIGTQLTAPGSVSSTVGFVRAQITSKLPKGYELSAGILRPLFTEDYGAQLWYEEEYHDNFASSNSYLGSMDDVGIELYKNYELGNVSLPTYLYVLGGAGSQFTDNNNGKGILLHIAPEIGPIKLMGSLFNSAKWAAVNTGTINRWSGGLGYEAGNFMFRGEYMGGDFKDRFLSTSGVTKNLKPWGYYAKVGYRVAPWLRPLISYARYKQDFTDSAKQYIDETYWRLSPILNIYVSPESILFVQYDITSNKRVDGSAKLEYNRLVLGWRTTF